MLLLVDAGNTRLKWCCLDGSELPLKYESVGYDELGSEGARLFQPRGTGIKADIERVLICHVAGQEIHDRLVEMFAEWQIVPDFVSSQSRFLEVKNAYGEPGKLGVDRWMALVGAWVQERDAVCVVDCGTAVTIDVLDARGQHLGGMIVPGLRLMRDALARETRIEGTQVEGIQAKGVQAGAMGQRHIAAGMLARDTAGAIATGTLYALASLIERTVERTVVDLNGERLGEAALLITGGDAETIRPFLGCRVRYEPMLVFRGMLAVAGTTF